VGLSSLGEKENAPSIVAQAGARRTLRTNFWTIVGFCVAGLICSLIIQTSYLHLEKTSVMLADAPLS
jgi:CBS-domain-containing membrane protein